MIKLINNKNNILKKKLNLTTLTNKINKCGIQIFKKITRIKELKSSNKYTKFILITKDKLKTFKINFKVKKINKMKKTWKSLKMIIKIIKPVTISIIILIIDKDKTNKMTMIHKR
jgi:hypothetical protein